MLAYIEPHPLIRSCCAQHTVSHTHLYVCPILGLANVNNLMSPQITTTSTITWTYNIRLEYNNTSLHKRLITLLSLHTRLAARWLNILATSEIHYSLNGYGYCEELTNTGKIIWNSLFAKVNLLPNLIDIVLQYLIVIFYTNCYGYINAL